MKIKLLAGYRGVLTQEAYYPAGIYDDISMSIPLMRYLVQNGRAELLEDEPAPKEPETRKPRSRS